MPERIRWEQVANPGGNLPGFRHFCFDHPTPSEEGFVVRVWPRSGNAWTGNFQRSVTDYADVMEWPEASLLVVIAYGACYFVNRDVPEQYVAHPSGGVMHPPTFNADRSLLLIADYGDVYAYDRTATLVWRREELSDFEVRFGSSTGNTVAIVTENDTGEHEVTIWLSCTDGRTVR